MSPDGVFAYVVNSIAWSFVGAASVVIWCRLRNGDRPVMRVRKPNWLVIIAIAILVFAIASTLVSYGVDSRQRRFVAC